VTVAPTHKHQRPELSAIDDLVRIHYRRVEAVIVADLCDSASGVRRFAYGGYFGKVPSTWLFGENMLSDFQAGYRDR